ncbi:MAG: cobalamin B12-binding domain-containing protein [Candidatus Solibacter usitatus]|nr:cobalamin B12-binding domain-containing protein [Candidatus Solibacter usitatus]
MAESVSDRFRIVQKIAAVKQNVAQAISDEFFVNHPEWAARYGERGRSICTADTCFHLEFLAGAIEAGSPEAFADYARWTARMLSAREVAAHALDENFVQLGKHLSPKLAPDEREWVLTFLARGRAACLQPEPASTAPPTGDRLELTRKVFIAAILAGNRHAALNIVEEALRDGHSHLDIYVGVFTESLRRVGELWELNKISVAQEHMATAITQYAIAAIYPRMVPAAGHRGNMVVTGVAGELHQVGANLVADAMEAHGWTVRFLGTNLPHSSILAAVEEISADMLCISTTIVANLPSVVDLVETVRHKLKESTPKIVLGGAAYRRSSQFAAELGATEGGTDLRRALALYCG